MGLLLAATASAGDVQGVGALVSHLNANGISMAKAVSFTAGKDLGDDGFDTLEMVKVMQQDAKTLEVMYAFRLWRQKNLPQTKRRLKMGRLFEWDMTVAGTVVLEWREGSQRKAVLAAFEDFRKMHKLTKTRE